MASLEEIRRWLQGENVAGLPPRELAWDRKPTPRLSKPDVEPGTTYKDEAFADKIRRKAKEERGRKSKEALKGKGALTHSKLAARFRVSEDGDDAMLLFGKHNGSNVSDLATANPGYLRWMETQEFPKKLIEIVKHQQALLITRLAEEDDEDDDGDVKPFSEMF